MQHWTIAIIVVTTVLVTALLVLLVTFAAIRETPPAPLPPPIGSIQEKASLRWSDGRPRVVFTLTTIPSRVLRVAACVHNLLRQSVRPDAVIVNLPDVGRRHGWRYHVPEELRRLAVHDSRVIVNRCGADLGPATKIIPTLDLETNAQTRIFPVDDDCVFPEQYFEELLEASLREPNVVFGYHGLNIKSRQTGEWAFVNQHEGVVDVVETVTGAVYRRGMLNGLKAPEDTCPCVLADDIWINDYVARRGFQRKLLMSDPDRVTSRGRRGMPMMNDLGANDPLYLVNVFGGANGGNSKCLRYLHLTRDAGAMPKLK